MMIFSINGHRKALVWRRIKSVVEHGAMARLFRHDTHRKLQEELRRCLAPAKLARIQTRRAYDRFIIRTAESKRWRPYCRDGNLDEVRWGHFAKLVNIVVYEMLSNRELFVPRDWKRLESFLHLPVDRIVAACLRQLDPTFPRVRKLKGMTKADYWRIQEAARRLARERGIPPIWFEAAWSHPDGRRR